MALGAYEAVESAQRTDVYVIVSCGGRQEFFETSTERADMWLATAARTAGMAAESVNMADALAQDLAVEAVCMTAADMVDRDVVNDWLDDDSMYR